MTTALTREDKEKLSNNCSVLNKTIIGQKVCLYYNGPHLSENGRKLAENIFRIMVRDVEVKVRQALSENLKNAHNLPQDLIDKLIADEASVAVPFIKYYQNLSEKDLLLILHSQEETKQIAVAERNNLSQNISSQIVKDCPKTVVVALVDNATADISEDDLNQIADNYSSAKDIQKGLICRTELPTSVFAKIIDFLSLDLKEQLITNHRLPTDLASDITRDVSEKIVLQISEEYSTDQQIQDLIAELQKNNNLSPSLLMRSLCLGDVKFFEYALSQLAGMPVLEVRKILFNSHLDFMTRNLLRKASIPKTMFQAIFSAFKIVKDLNFDCCRTKQKDFSNRVIERLLSLGNSSEDLSEPDINYLLSKIQ